MDVAKISPEPGTVPVPGKKVHRNLPASALVEAAVIRGEAQLTEPGALLATTGRYTGRSPKDKFIVKDAAVANTIAWGPVNQPWEPARFDNLLRRVLAYLDERETFVFDGAVGAEPQHQLRVRVVTEMAWHNLFARQLFLRPDWGDNPPEPDFTIISAPGFQAQPDRDGTRSEAFVVINFTRRIILIGGTHYAGEIKKSVFTVMNYLLPDAGVFPMHCSANVGEQGDSALYFGLSGTGKTTLSADPNRRLVGDDEHGWWDGGIFNFEGGCYAKCIGLEPEKEPLIYNAIRFGSVLENVVVDPRTRVPDYHDGSLTENTRVAYPVDFIPGAVIPGVAGHPRTIFFLTADASGVLPPIARLTPEQAMYHFLSGYTSKLAGTERGITDPEPTFSACFGEPFLPRSPVTYAKLLGDMLQRHDATVYLVNTGWTGGPYGVGKRMELKYTRAMVSAALAGQLKDVAVKTEPFFGLHVPVECPGVPSELLDARSRWSDGNAYDDAARRLAGFFRENFARFQGADLPPEIVAAGPQG